MRNPIIRNYFYEIVSGNELIFFYNKKNLTFTGESVGLIIKILPFLDGHHDIKEISCETSIKKSEVEEIIQFLINKNIVSIKNKKTHLQTTNNEQFNLYKAINKHSSESEAMEEFSIITSKKVFVDGERSLVDKLVDSLQELLIVTNKEEDADLFVGIDNYENKSLFSKLNDLALNNGKPFIKSLIEEQQYSIGPIFSNQSSCYICYWNRVFSNFQNPKKDWEYYKKYHEKMEGSSHHFPGMEELFINSLKINILKYFTNYRSQLFFNEYNYNPILMEGSFNYILKVPGCSKCKELNNIEEFTYEVNR